MSAEAELRNVVLALCAQAAAAWSTGRPLLAERFFEGAVTVLGHVEFVDVDSEADR